MKVRDSDWWTWLLFLFFGCVACTPDPSCSDIYIPAVLAGFYEMDENGNPVQQQLFFDSIYAEGVSADTFLIDKSDTIDVYPLFVNPEANTTTYQFCLDGACNQITFTYNRREFLLSPECGPRSRYQNLQAEYDFDSISILKTELTVVGDINVQIFR